MSVKRRGGDPEGNYYYRFTYKGHAYCQGGYRTKDQAETGERLAKDLAIKRVQSPDDYAGDMTFRQAGEWWLKEYAPSKRSQFVDKGRMPVIMDCFDKTLLKDIRPSDIDTFLSKLSELRERKISDHTRNHYRALIHAVYERLKRKKMYRGENPASYVDKLDVPTARVRFIYPSEEKLLTPRVALHKDLDAYYRLGIGTGMRLGEMQAARVKHIDLTLKHIFLPSPKNSKSRYVPLDGPEMGLVASLMAGKGQEDYLLPHWGSAYIRDHFYAICDELDIKNLHLHDWRHTFAYNLLSQGASIYKVSLLLGHSSTEVTQKHYGHLAAKDLRDAKESVRPFLSCNRIVTADEILESTNDKTYL